MTDCTRVPEKARPKNTFDDYAAAGFRDDLLSIVPHDASVHSDSIHLTTSRAKVPMRGCAKWVPVGSAVRRL